MADKKPIKRQEFDSKEERLKVLRSTASSINKKLGIEGLKVASDIEPYKRCPSDIKELDEFTGNFLVHGNFTTIWGGKGSAKTTLALKMVARAQREGKIVYWIALENFDPERAKWAGVNMDELLIGQFPQAEQCLDTIIEYAKKKLVDVIVLDSIHGMSPKGEQENKKGDKSLSDNTIGLLASKLSSFFRQAVDPIKRAEIAVLLIGQTRIKISPIVSIEHLSGGNALLHNSRLIIKMSKGPNDNAPRKVTYIDSDEKDENGDLIVDKKGKPKQKKVEEITGFPIVFRLDAVQVNNCKPERSVLTIPYYYESGYNLPQYILDENKEIDEALNNKDTCGNNTEEESDQAICTTSGKNEGESTNEPKIIAEIPKKRGRPKKV